MRGRRRRGRDRFVVVAAITVLVAASWKAVRIYDYGQPVFMNPNDNSTALTTMEAASDELAARLGEPTTKPVPALPGPPAYAPEHAP